MRSFDQAWNEIVDYVTTRSHVVTLVQEIENRVRYNKTTDAIVVESDVPNTIEKADFERVWKELESTGHLSRENTREAMGKYRASIVLALLVGALDLQYDTNPVTVYPPASR